MTGSQLDGGAPALSTPNTRPARLRQLGAAALVAWCSCALAVVALDIQHARGVQHFQPFAFLMPLAAQAGAIVVAAGIGAWNLIFRRRPGVSVLLAALAMSSGLLWVAVAAYGLSNWKVRNTPNNFLMNLARRGGASLMEAQAAWSFPFRDESEHLVMFHDGVTDPEGDLSEMEAHVRHLETLLGGPLREPIHWVRGPLLGQSGCSVYGLAVWAPQAGDDGDIQVDPVDRHEVAHAAIAQFLPPDADPPTILSEGWAQAHQNGWLGPRLLRESEIWADYRSIGDSWGEIPPLPDLFGPDWYHQDSGPVYPVGAHLVRYLINRHGPAKFLELCSTIRPRDVDGAFQRVYGTTLADLEAALEAASRDPAQPPVPAAPAPENGAKPGNS